MFSRSLSLIAIAAGAVSAQQPAPAPAPHAERVQIIATPAPGPGAATVTFLSAESSFEAADVKGAPFQGDFVTESMQSLADGNRIRSTNTTSYARDGEGRTRREMKLDSIGPWAASGGQLRTIFIHDPVAKIDYILDPQAKTARKVSLANLPAPSADTAAGPVEVHKEQRIVIHRRTEGPAPAGGAGENVTFERRVAGPGTEDVLIATGGATPMPLVLPAGAGIRTAAGNAAVKSEPLGKRNIEGLEAEGTRSVVTIPAGQVGNERPLETVSERWYSNELKTVVLTTRKDPRMGESTYRLTNLRRGEPARSLFEVPPDYKVIEEGPRPVIMRFRQEKKQ